MPIGCCVHRCCSAPVRHGLSTVGVVSAVNGEGKTLTAINLAMSLAAEPNQTVMLVDLDLRRPAIARRWACRRPRAWRPGSVAMIRPAKSAMRSKGSSACTCCRHWHRCPAAPETLAGLGTRRLLNELKDRDSGRLLIVDLPPVLLSDDALMVAPLLDAVVLVVNERRTRREDVARVMELLGNTRDCRYRAQSVHRIREAGVLRAMYESSTICGKSRSHWLRTRRSCIWPSATAMP